jgi:hypothetical protein
LIGIVSARGKKRDSGGSEAHGSVGKAYRNARAARQDPLPLSECFELDDDEEMGESGK